MPPNMPVALASVLRSRITSRLTDYDLKSKPLLFSCAASSVIPTRWRRPPSLDRLSNDVLIDGVFRYLNVEDILRLRRVSKLYYYLTHEPVIWKRMLRWLRLPFPPLPPSTRYTLENLSNLETERLITRALSLEKTWLSKRLSEGANIPRWEFDTHRLVDTMFPLPGGHYLIASTRNPLHTKYNVTVFSLDNRYGGAVALVDLEIPTKAIQFYAKYGTHHGKRGIYIAYICRNYRRKSDRGRVNISLYSPEYEVDSPVKIVYECTVVHVAFSTLEVLGACEYLPASKEYIEFAQKQGAPFREVHYMKSRSRYSCLSIDDIGGELFLVVAHMPNRIMFKNLGRKQIFTLTLPVVPELRDLTHTIVASRVLAIQRQIMVLRQITETVTEGGQPLHITTMELYNIPYSTTDERITEEAKAVDRAYITTAVPLNFWKITEQCTPEPKDDTVIGELNLRSSAPLPITLFARMGVPPAGDGLFYLVMYPEQVPGNYYPTRWSPTRHRTWDSLPPPPEEKWLYDLQHASFLQQMKAPEGKRYHVLPGSRRTLLYTVDADDRTDDSVIDSIVRYHDVAWDWEKLNTDQVEWRRRVRWMDEVGVERATNQSVQSIVWDETIGRLLLNETDSSKILVYDFARTRKEDWLGRHLPLSIDRSQVPMDEDGDESQDPLGFVTRLTSKFGSLGRLVHS
ncbi:hypothetical protein K474DRAFT_1771767 [Panus rudis PR-1116 ss-1]|nr:hypothetical protein K474DRAFT_1771767 [Panus rudis PR-1116 ss-1]